jgi:folate-binding protein YgfZ
MHVRRTWFSEQDVMKRGPLYELQKASGATFDAFDGWELPAVFGSPDDELKAWRASAGLADLSGWGLLRLRGANRLDFVQRMSTNDVHGLTPGQSAPTVFTTPIGRIVDLACVLAREDDLLLIVGRGADERVAHWLRRHIFFNDDVQVENWTDRWVLLGLGGPDALALLGLDDFPVYHSRAVQIGGGAATLARAILPGFELAMLAAVEHATAVWTALQAAGATPVGEMALETARITAGWPRFGRELTEDYIPLEAGLKGAISFSKGCYVGQEIIARMDTYQRLAKRLVGLNCEPGPKAGDQVWAEASKVGQVTSVAPLAEGGALAALAYVKTAVAEPGRQLTVVTEGGRLAAEIVQVSGEN